MRVREQVRARIHDVRTQVIVAPSIIDKFPKQGQHAGLRKCGSRVSFRNSETNLLN